MKHKNVIRSLGVLTCIMTGLFFVFSTNNTAIITENIEALSISYEWRPAQNSTWYIPIEMGEEPTDYFRKVHPGYTYYRAPGGTRPSTGLQFWNLGDERWDELSHCAGTESMFPEVIMSGQYCYARFSGSSSFWGGDYGTMYADY